MMSAIILAGGKSSRMGTDKAFLKYRGKYFIELLKEQARKVSDDVIIAIGEKDRGKFEFLLNDGGVTILNDKFNISNPLGGMITGFDQANKVYAATIACDLPRAQSRVLEFLYKKAQNHSAAIPMWADNKIEPLCAVYQVEEARQAALETVNSRNGGPRNMVLKMKDVCFVSVSEFQACDKDLGSFLNINSEEDYSNLTKRLV
jgi:molybdenum cofactor guanylyltransferase